MEPGCGARAEPPRGSDRKAETTTGSNPPAPHRQTFISLLKTIASASPGAKEGKGDRGGGGGDTGLPSSEKLHRLPTREERPTAVPPPASARVGDAEGTGRNASVTAQPAVPRPAGLSCPLTPPSLRGASGDDHRDGVGGDGGGGGGPSRTARIPPTAAKLEERWVARI